MEKCGSDSPIHRVESWSQLPIKPPLLLFFFFITDRYSRNPGLISHNVCVCAVVRFWSRVLSPTPNVERRYKLWATLHRTIEETFCCALGRDNRQLVHDLSQVVRYFSLTSPSPLLAKRWVVFSFAFFKLSDVICRGARKLWSYHALSAGIIVVLELFWFFLHRLRSQTLCCLPRPVYGDASRAWCTTFSLLLAGN